MTTWPSNLSKLATIAGSTAPTLGKHNSYNASAAARTPVLPALTSGSVATALAASQLVRVKVSKSKADTSTNAVTLTCSGSDTFEDGTTTLVLNAAGEKVTLTAATIPGGSGPVWIVEEHTVPRDTLDTRFLTPAQGDGKYALASSTVPAPATPVQSPNRTLISNFQTGHGWTDGGGTGTVNLSNTASDAPIGTQYVSITTGGTGSAKNLVRTGYTAMDLSDKWLAVLCRVSDTTKLGTFQLYTGNPIGTNNESFYVTAGGTTAETVHSGAWTWVHFGFTEKVNQAGTPNRAAITDLQFRVQDQAAGAVTIDIAAIGYFSKPNTTGTKVYPNGVVTLTFDDCFASHYSIARAYLDTYGLSGSVFPILSRLDQAGYMTTAQLLSLYQTNGWDIGGHATTDAAHSTSLTGMTLAAAETELLGMRQWLTQNGVVGGDFMATPNGLDNEAVQKLILKYFSLARSTAPLPQSTLPGGRSARLTAVSVGTQTLAQLTPYVDKAKANGTWQIFTIHDILASGTETATAVLQSKFQSLVDYCVTNAVPILPMSKVKRAALDRVA